MSSYTEFGIYFRILRLKHNEILADAKKYLGVSTAFISSVECGKKAIPEDWFQKITNHFHLSSVEQKELRDSIDKSQKYLKIDMGSLNNIEKNFVLQFQRSFKDIDDETMLEIQQLLERRKKK